MSSLLGAMALTTPWALLGLLALPVLYLLLKITPPAPKTIDFPAVRFLQELIPGKTTPSKTPPWILLLRMLTASILLLALSGPILNPTTALSGKGPLHLIIENGWSAAQHWQDITGQAEKIIKAAQKDNREIIIHTTTKNASEYYAPSVLIPTQALENIKALKPYPWSPELENFQEIEKIEGDIYFLSDGLDKPHLKNFIETLKNFGTLEIIAPKEHKISIIKNVNFTNKGASITIEMNAKKETSFYLEAHTKSGEILNQVEFTKSGEIFMPLPQAELEKIHKFKITNQNHAAAYYYLEDNLGKKNISIISKYNFSDEKKLSDDVFFLNNALEPYSNITLTNTQNVLENKNDVIILPDIGGMSADILNALDTWVQSGGMIIRFAGPHMIRQAEKIPLTPVKLRSESRNLDGTISLEKPLKISPFTNNSPLYGIAIEEDILIKQQILPIPTNDLAKKTWAKLEDGTPFITASSYGSGILIFIHTTASPEWSNFPLSGTYLDVLKRLINLAGNTQKYNSSYDGILQPLQTLDGFGILEKPSAEAKGIDAKNFLDILPGPSSPPGIYEAGGVKKIKNLGPHSSPLKPLPSTWINKTYAPSEEINLFAPLIVLAFILVLVDTVILLFLNRGTQLIKVILITIFFLTGFSQKSSAQNESYENNFYLAYIKTNNSALDEITQKGLDNLARILSSRTSAEPKGAVGIDLELSDLAFFPVLYWGIYLDQKPISQTGLEKLQLYINNGGTLIIDTRDGGSKRNAETLVKLLSTLSIESLIPLPEDHVLTKSFYLLNNFPGRYDGHEIWIESTSAKNEAVSSIILGSHDWAGAWSEINIKEFSTQFRAIGLSQQQEYSLRTGINFVLYALTGNYKSDQVHIPAILERLDQ